MQRFKHYIKRMSELGLLGSIKQLNHRATHAVRTQYFKQKALNNRIAHSWKQIQTIHNLEYDFETFFNTITSEAFVARIQQNKVFFALTPSWYWSQQQIIARADRLAQGTIELLGSQPFTITPDIDWHSDFKQNQKSKDFPQWHTNRLLYYKDITIDLPTYESFDSYWPDIKVPWELSRFQHFAVLARGYQLTKDERYTQTFCRQLNDWIDKNPVLLGSNWVCPMDVALRAINIIWATQTFKKNKRIATSFWEKVTTSLYDHAWYLERNWEISDKPSNHYLSDLVGYLYLCSYFSSIPYFAQAFDKCLALIFEQANHQILSDGTSYEGSTYYHRLVTELFLHAQWLSEAHGKHIPADYRTKMDKSLAFMHQIADKHSEMIQIGDNDSGKCVLGLAPTKQLATDGVHHFSNFGLTVINHKTIQASFRHPTFSNMQPSGHFHHDYLSITLAINGNPVLVDPGSYLYTTNPKWRKHFKSINVHNTFSTDRSIPDDPALFYSHRPETDDTSCIDNVIPDPDLESTQIANNILVRNYHALYHQHGLQAHRELCVENDKKIIVHDWWTSGTSQTVATKWNFTFHPSITLEKIRNTSWLLVLDGSHIATITTHDAATRIDSHFSPAYGVIKKTTALRVMSDLHAGQKVTTIFEVI